ncbi:MAG TPA: DUF349 domain-containing protein [Paucimonas sp.]|nr:DUF349 domain-containing protein [Paucimonas sp.]HJW56233.1 DUF349 domain-containing protein [Burkholderiaceae bacterium]
MFDFIFKRSAGKSASIPQLAQTPVSDSKAQQVAARQSALVQAEALDGDEPAAVEFILQCQFADARLKAASMVQSRLPMERVLQAMRDTDRRVVKLMQSRLDVLKRQENSEQEALQCIEHARRLMHESRLMPNQVAELDRAWLAIDLQHPALQHVFDQVRSTLRERLAAQTDLQHAMLDMLARLRMLLDDENTAPYTRFAEMAEQAAKAMTQWQVSPEAASLPRHLTVEFAQLHGCVEQRLAFLAQYEDALGQRRDMLERWEASDPAALDIRELKQEWHALPALPEDSAVSLEIRFHVMLQRITALHKPETSAVHAQTQKNGPDIAEILDAMETALQEGALQAAAGHDKTLRAMDVKAERLDGGQAARLAKIRAELGRLHGWARWGGNVSRDELLKAVQSLPTQMLAAPELAKKVSALREHWKSLDASAGPASKELWERFDADCTEAYAPAAAHFRKQAEERHHNLEAARSLIAECSAFIAASHGAEKNAATVDWKEAGNFCMRMRQAWHRLGPIERKQKKQLDAEFAIVMEALSAPLAHQREIEIKRREALIAAVEEIVPNDRAALELLRAQQERWQAYSKAMPLNRKDEQALWQRFRNACDAVFAKRKEFAVAADADRRQHLLAKEALSATLENAVNLPDAAILKTLREAKNEWERIGQVPRASEQRIEARYTAAVNALQQRLNASRQEAMQSDRQLLRNKVRLCRILETAVHGEQEIGADALQQSQSSWEAFSALPGDIERAMQARFSAVWKALQAGDRKYAVQLETNRPVLLQELLRCEILLGIDSPPELSRQRLQLQVEVLQSSLGSGQKRIAHDVQLLRLCALPAVAEQSAAARLDRLIDHMNVVKS